MSEQRPDADGQEQDRRGRYDEWFPTFCKIRRMSLRDVFGSLGRAVRAIRAERFPTFARVVRWRGWRIGAYALLVVILIGGVANLAGTVYFGGKLKGELRELKAQGKPLTLAQVAPPPVPDSQNAAPLYLRAAELTEHVPRNPSAGAPGGPPPGMEGYEQPATYDMYDPNDVRQLAILSELIKQDHEAFELIREASEKPTCRFDVEWEKGYEMRFPYLAKTWHLARVLAAAAEVATHEGDQAEALERLRMGFSLAGDVSEEPDIIAQLVAHGMDAIMLRAAEYVLFYGPAPEQEARRLMQELGREEYIEQYVTGIRTERAGALDFYNRLAKRPVEIAAVILGGRDDTREAWEPLALWWAYAKLLRPLLMWDELGYLRLIGEVEAMAPRPWRQATGLYARFHSEIEQLPLAPVTRLLVSGSARLVIKRDQTIAHRSVLQGALGLKVYRQRHGRHPESLAQLDRIGWQIPQDIFSGNDLMYRRDGDRFVLYSIGPDLKDNDGHPLCWLDPKQRSRDETVWFGPIEVDAGDICWIWWDERVKAIQSARGQ